MIDAAALAFRDILSPPFRGVLLKSLALTIGAARRALARRSNGWSPTSSRRPGRGSTPLLDVLTGVGLVVGLGFLVAPVAALFAGLFLDDIAEAVERTHYPAEPPGQPLPLARSLADVAEIPRRGAARERGRSAAGAPPRLRRRSIFLVANAYLLGREYFELAALRHHDEATVRRLRARHSGRSSPPG